MQPLTLLLLRESNDHTAVHFAKEFEHVRAHQKKKKEKEGYTPEEIATEALVRLQMTLLRFSLTDNSPCSYIPHPTRTLLT